MMRKIQLTTAASSYLRVSVNTFAKRQVLVNLTNLPWETPSGPSVTCQHFHCTPVQNGIFTPKEDISWWGRTLKKFGFTDIPKSTLMRSGCLMYMKTADELDYMKFFKYCNLPDTFASWVNVLELHIWLLSAKLMQHDREGRIVRNALIKAMWEDNEIKSKNLEGALSSARRRDLAGLRDQFNAALFSYDEGLMSNDYVLAGALWRRFLRPHASHTELQQTDVNFEDHEALAKQVKALEMLVIYVRSQFYMLNNLSREQLIRKHAFKWAPFDESLYELVSKFEKSPAPAKEVNKIKLRN